MTRRDALVAAAGLLVVPGALAQGASRVVRIAILDDAKASTRAALWARFRTRLAELGYAEGRNATVEAHFADGDPARLRALATAVAAAKPDVVVTVTTGAGLAMKQATSTVPVVVIGPADPVRSGLVASLARPGGNITGLSPNQAEIADKWLELLRVLLPGARTFAYLTDPANPGEMLVFEDLERRAKSLGLEGRVLGGVESAQVDRALAEMTSRRPDALIVATTASLVPHRQRIVEGVARLRIPAIYARQEYAEAGGLVSYGADSRMLWVRAAEYVDRIVRGTRPADMPFEMASTFRLVLNATTAHSLGLAIPASVRARVDKLVE
ncbi:MAG TPA: ABC transporter substrate-binding protein [Casimicrobiaceae bacterium]|nr:ABC transporter substrate-binding protein [Casimicrobiaceae bacterium]